MEYHVTFPSPTPRTEVPSGEAAKDDDFIHVRCDAREPVVLLLGWAGCHDRNLAKYSVLYEIKGCITIRYAPPAQDVFFRPNRFQRVALKLLELLSDLNLEEHPVMFHMFSNGGCLVYRCISDILAGDVAMSQINIKGCVFDSGPAISSLLGATQAAMTSVRGGQLYRVFVGVATFLYLGFTGLVAYAVGLIWKNHRGLFIVDMWWGLAEEKSSWPQLFLYSKADKLCQHESIRKFVEFRRDNGVPVHSVCWDDSPHVGHLRVHREAYTQQINNFLDVCVYDVDST